jgi:hypothetical protein
MIEPEKIYTRLVAMGTDWAEKQHAANMLSETRKSVLAQIMTDYLIKGDSAVKAETFALSSDLYQGHIKAMVDAEKESNLARVNYESAKTWAESVRTAESTRRAEMRLV